MTSTLASVSSLAFPAGTSLATQAATIRRHGFTVLDPRGTADGEVDPGAPATWAEARRILDGEGVRAGCVFGYPHDNGRIRQLCDCASAIGAEQVRILTGRPTTLDQCRALVAPLLQGDGPTLVLQNHRMSSLDLEPAIALMEAVNHPRLRLACSPDHEVQEGRWNATLRAAAARWTAIWFWQDVVQDRQDWLLCLPGDGALADLPTYARGRICCKWEHRWHAELPGPDIALPRYSAALSRC